CARAMDVLGGEYFDFW
nr:immunoglobulin heavy chain junction region [Macaca mulatta]MOV49412.1 immunoglobulin heavy chain junction region [Macaca mulatta]MOV49659.1 immunoglobulin heavy chain junction region [Macaca mulatta]MOV49867.1 immunoglobulin heavy chain junction region [Macaca mulatta]MOV50346.1 immunoglobulin heavy chain junction region [Macaca mulatta]